MNIYIIGPVTGKPGLNREAFAEARAERLRRDTTLASRTTSYRRTPRTSWPCA